MSIMYIIPAICIILLIEFELPKFLKNLVLSLPGWFMTMVVVWLMSQFIQNRDGAMTAMVTDLILSIYFIISHMLRKTPHHSR